MAVGNRDRTNAAAASHAERSSSRHSRSDFLCRIKFRNALPDIPFDPKFLRYPFENNRFTDYNTTSLEREHKHELLTDTDVGVKNGLIDPEAYTIDQDTEIDDTDKALLEVDGLTSLDRKMTKHSRIVSWMRRNEYLSNEGVRAPQTSEKPETKVGYSIRKYVKNHDKYKDRDAQIKAIEDTFEAAKKPISEHPTKPGVTPKRIYPILPDFEMWKHSFAVVTFDSNPSQLSDGTKVSEEQMTNAVIRGMQEESGDQFVGYYIPEKQGRRKRKQSEGDEGEPSSKSRDFALAREYNWVVKTRDASREDNYFFSLRDNHAYYNEVETKVRLTRRRVRSDIANRRLKIEYRGFNAEEQENQKVKMAQLEDLELDDDFPKEKEEGKQDTSYSHLSDDDTSNSNLDDSP